MSLSEFCVFVNNEAFLSNYSLSSYYFKALEIDIPSIINNVDINDIYPTNRVKNVEIMKPFYENTYGTINGPVPNITLIIIIIVINAD